MESLRPVATRMVASSQSGIHLLDASWLMIEGSSCGSPFYPARHPSYLLGSFSFCRAYKLQGLWCHKGTDQCYHRIWWGEWRQSAIWRHVYAPSCPFPSRHHIIHRAEYLKSQGSAHLAIFSLDVSVWLHKHSLSPQKIAWSHPMLSYRQKM